MGNDMSLAELLGNLSLETQIIIAGVVVLFVILALLHASNLRDMREREAAHADREMRARLDRLMQKLEGKSIGANGRIVPAVSRPRPLSRTADKKVPAARCPAPVKAQGSVAARR